jgi:hypothetical protein
MLLAIHIIVAIAGLVVAALAALVPSRGRERLSYILLGGTLGSGAALVWYAHAAVTTACVSGLVYTAIVLSLVAVSRFRLARVRVRSHD